MKKSQTYRLFLPPEIKKVIDVNVKRNHINYYFLVHHIYSRSLCLRNNENGFININSSFYESITGYAPDTYINLLRKCEVIIHNNTYQVGKKKLHYKINPTLKTTPKFYELSQDTPLYIKMKKEIKNNRAHVNLMPEHQKMMYKLFMSLNLDYSAAFNWIANDKSLSSKQKLFYSFSVESFRNKDFRYFKRNKTNNRLDSNLSNLPKNLRQFIKTPNLVSIDLNNSQPFMLFLLLNILLNNTTQNNKPLCYYIKNPKLFKTFGKWPINNISKTHKIHQKLIDQEISRLKTWTMSGKFYDNFILQYNTNISRSDIKSAMIKVLFSNNIIYNKRQSYIPYQKDKEIFSKVFPNVYNIIMKLKSKDNSNLPNYLSKIESYIFIDNICKNLHSAGITPLTIHDSVIIQEHEAEKTLEIMQNTFNELTGFVPTFSIEPIN